MNHRSRIFIVLLMQFAPMTLPSAWAALSFDGFPIKPDHEVNPTLLYALLVALLVWATAVAGIAVHIFRINRRLEKSLAGTIQTKLQLKILSTAIDQSPTSVLITGADTVIQYVNPSFTKVTGYSSDEAIGQTPKFMQSGLTKVATYQQMWGQLTRGEQWTGELLNRRKSGEIYWEEVHIAPVKDAQGHTTHYVAVKLDITERKEAHDRLAHMAYHDKLTNLPNRTLFFERVAQGLALARRHKTRLALMFIDLDKFKEINDTDGHAVGDLVLQEVANRMSDCLRDSDTVGRIGGDEFVVLLPDAGSEESSIIVANKINAALNRPFVVADKECFISSSIGIALYPEHGSGEIELIKKADLAMYHAKVGGGDNVKVFKTDMEEEVLS
ncbi:MAG: diguanylate cyclase domain-containing protein [Burkholderiales bacterium]